MADDTSGTSATGADASHASSSFGEMSVTPIGVIRTPFAEPSGTPIQPAGGADVEGFVQVFAEYHDGLADLAGFSHVVLLYWLHASDGYDLRLVPFLDDVERGLFATRAPRRPNPIGLSVVRLVRIEDGILHIQGVDIVDGTPLLDIKPYVPEFDTPTNVRAGWLEDVATEEIAERKSDRRFE
jgi:tRNA-Thr(GGU) m(6)t(6)A37 methyltransferase TsaA